MLRLAKTAFLLLIFSLPLMKAAIPVGGLAVTVTDAIFIVTIGALAMAVVSGEAKLRWNGFYVVLLLYFAAMLVSAIGSAQPSRTALKLASQAYLLSLPVLACTLIDSRRELRAAFAWWLAATAIVAGLGALTAALFALGVEGPLAEYGLHEFGTLAPGPYPRIESTFAFPAMLCNYLTVSLMILLVSRRLGWVGSGPFRLLSVAIGLTAVFSLTPGLGGILLAISVWLYLSCKARSPRFALAALAAGCVAALLFIVAAAVTPIVHPTAPFLITVPGLDQPVAPAVRMMTWMDSWARFLVNPLLGTGIGTDAVAVRYVDPSGFTHGMTDAHNVFLNIAVQCGLLGVAAMVVLIAGVARTAAPFRLDGPTVIRAGLGLAWLNAFVYQGLTGSYEDARHLWLLVGLLLVAKRIEGGDGSRQELHGANSLPNRHPGENA